MTFSKIMLFGRPGGGKSTFALWLARQTGYPLHHLDKFFFNENWVERPEKEFLQIQQEFVKGAQWIIDGNSTRSLELRYSHADIALFFNFPKILCLWRLLKRYYFPNQEIDDRAEGCPERIRWRLIQYLWTFEQRVGSQIVHLKKLYPNVAFFEIQNDSDLCNIKKLF